MRKACIIMAISLIFSTLANAEEKQIFPLGNRMLKEQGIDFPLPFGISVIFNRVMDETEISGLKFPVVGEIPGVNFKKSESKTDAYNLRADLWLLPFMNVYVIGGYFEGESKTKIEIRAPGTAAGIEINIDEDYNGDTFGIGTTLVYGVKNTWVASLDVNYAETELNVVDSDIKSLVISPRISYCMKQYGFPCVLGFGVVWLDNDQTLTVKIPLENARRDLTTHLDIENKKKWNTALTAAFELDKHWQLALDIGFYDRRSFMTLLGYRF